MLDMPRNDIAYFTLSQNIRSSGDSVRLPYFGYNSTLAKGRVLVVPMPAFPEVHNAYSGAFQYREQAAEALARTPDRDELSKAHVLGLHLVNAAMGGNPHSISHIWDERPRARKGAIAKKRPLPEIAIPAIFMLRKLGLEQWMPSYRENQDVFIDFRPIVNLQPVIGPLQIAANALCDVVRINRIDLSEVDSKTELQPFPLTRLRKARYRAVARSLRAQNWKSQDVA